MKNVVIGAGITGLFAAYLLKKKKPAQEVYLIERSSRLGGLLKSAKYDEHGYFDYGIHTIYETEIPIIDNFFLDVMPETEWIFNRAHKRDYGGTYIQGKLQTNAAYVDLRNFSTSKTQEFVNDFFKERSTDLKGDSAKEYFVSRYGALITNEVIEPILQKVYGCDSEKLDPIVAKVLPLERVVMFNQDTMDALLSSEYIRSRLAYTEQLLLPNHLLPNKKSLYPKAYGLQNLIDSIEEKLNLLGVHILKDTSLVDVKKTDEIISALTARNLKSGEISQINEIQDVYCTTGLLTSAQLLKVDPEISSWDRPLKTVIVNLLLSKKPNVKDLFYIYCLEPNFLTHRLACPSSFCPDSFADGKYKLSVEVILKDERIHIDQVFSKVISELESMNVSTRSDVIFHAVETVEGGYPMSTLNNSNQISKLRQRVADANIKNFKNIGLMSKQGLFFQTDMMKDVYDVIGVVD